jgi:hypothetical protein
MAALTSPSATAGWLALRVDRVVSAGQFSALHAADQVIVLRMQPSPRAARTATASLRQVASVHLTIRHGDVEAEVFGIGHRLPVDRTISVPAALALAAAGVTTYVTTDGSVGEGATEGVGA